MTLQNVLRLLLVFILLGQYCFAENIGLPDIDAKDVQVIDLLADGLSAWKAEDGRPIDNWKVSRGILVNSKAGSHLITSDKYWDFDLSLEFRLPPRGNSGIYLRGRYEIQLYDGSDVDAKKTTGSIWGQIPVESNMYRGANRWHQLQVRLKDHTVTVVIDRKPVIRSKKLTGPTRGAIDQNESQPGPILLQSLNGVQFRNVLLKKL